MVDKDNVVLFRYELIKAIKEVVEKYNYDLKIGTIKYGDINGTASLTFNVKGENGEFSEEISFKALCADYGFRLTDYHREVFLDRKIFT